MLFLDQLYSLIMKNTLKIHKLKLKKVVVPYL